jgi:hypothetical protein
MVGLIAFRYMQTSWDLCVQWADELQPAHGYLCLGPGTVLPDIPPYAPGSTALVEERSMHCKRLRSLKQKKKDSDETIAEDIEVEQLEEHPLQEAETGDYA